MCIRSDVDELAAKRRKRKWMAELRFVHYKKNWNEKRNKTFCFTKYLLEIALKLWYKYFACERFLPYRNLWNDLSQVSLQTRGLFNWDITVFIWWLFQAWTFSPNLQTRVFDVFTCGTYTSYFWNQVSKVHAMVRIRCIYKLHIC